MNVAVSILMAALINQSTPLPKYEIPVLQELRAIRKVNYGYQVLNDLEQHMPPEHIYRDNDRITWAHETTHGLNAEIRNRYQYKHNCYYVMNSKYVALPPCKLSLQGIKSVVPDFVMKDTKYLNFYFDNHTWDNAQYILEEWSAYINGACAYNEIKPQQSGESEVVFMLMFNVYTMYISLNEPNKEINNFIKYQTLRSRSVFLASKSQDAEVFWKKVSHGTEYQGLRDVIGQKWGKEWMKVLF
jgi:hypothetical protein